MIDLCEEELFPGTDQKYQTFMTTFVLCFVGCLALNIAERPVADAADAATM